MPPNLTYQAPNYLKTVHQKFWYHSFDTIIERFEKWKIQLDILLSMGVQLWKVLSTLEDTSSIQIQIFIIMMILLKTNLYNQVKFLCNRSIGCLDLSHRSRGWVDLEVFIIPCRSTLLETVSDGGVDGVHIDCLYFLWENVEGSSKDATWYL